MSRLRRIGKKKQKNKTHLRRVTRGNRFNSKERRRRILAKLRKKHKGGAS